MTLYPGIVDSSQLVIMMRNSRSARSRNPFATVGIFLQAEAHEPIKKKGEALEERVASPIEDLSKEHGVLERLLLIYDKVINDAASGMGFNARAINGATRIFKDYIGEHHDRCEERYIFPKFREANYIVELIDILQYQHDVAKRLTGEILERTSPGSPMDESGVKRVTSLCCSLVYMYRPHMSREQTVVSPTFYDIVTEGYIKDIKEEMEAEEKKLLGETGFRGLVGRVSEIEKEVGTHDLQQYIPQEMHAQR